jgi:hypothetical protein
MSELLINQSNSIMKFIETLSWIVQEDNEKKAGLTWINSSNSDSWNKVAHWLQKINFHFLAGEGSITVFDVFLYSNYTELVLW